MGQAERTEGTTRNDNLDNFNTVLHPPAKGTGPDSDPDLEVLREAHQTRQVPLPALGILFFLCLATELRLLDIGAPLTRVIS